MAEFTYEYLPFLPIVLYDTMIRRMSFLALIAAISQVSTCQLCTWGHSTSVFTEPYDFVKFGIAA